MSTWAAARKPDDEMATLSTGRYLRSMILGAETDVERRALAEGSDSAGGFTVPTILSARLIDALRAESVVTQAGAQMLPLTSDAQSIAAVATDPVPAWRSENATVAESGPTFRSVPMAPKSLAVMTRVSRELFEDSLNLESELPRILAAAMAVELDRVALLGSGSDPEPLGVANTAGIGTTAHDAALTAFAPLVTARTGILAANAGPVTAFIAHPRDEGELTGFVASDGQPLNAPGAVSAIPMLTTTSIPIDGGAGSDESVIFAGNFGHLLIGMRSEIRVEILRERFTDSHQFAIVAHLRADIAVEHAKAFHAITGVQG
jgi:HK97 family phage major capsid protein